MPALRGSNSTPSTPLWLGARGGQPSPDRPTAGPDCVRVGDLGGLHEVSGTCPGAARSFVL